MLLSRWRYLIILTAMGASATPAPAASVGSTNLMPRIVNGVDTVGYPAVGAVLSGTPARKAGLECSATLIGCNTVLTAAHCVCDGTCQGDDAPDPSKRFVYFQSGGVIPVSSIAVPPDYVPAGRGVGDLAVVRLAAPVSGIAPIRLTSAGRPAYGTLGTIVGFGISDGRAIDAGIKRVGSIVTEACQAGIANSTSICWAFTAPFGSYSNTCYGDSGGPLLIDFGAGAVLAGVTTAGTNILCEVPDHSYDVNVAAYVPWIEQQAGADLDTTTCGALPQIGAADARVTSMSGVITGRVSQLLTFTVPPGVSVLRVGFNGVDNGASDFDLYVRARDVPSLTAYDCRAKGPSQFGLCEFRAPLPGPWYAGLKPVSWNGAYQIVATMFGTDCSEAANEGAACDDGNPCTVDDTCHTGACVGAGVPPRIDCHRAVAVKGAQFKMHNRPVDINDRLAWVWKGSGIVQEDFGDPVHATDYTLCVYEQDALIVGKGVPAGGLCDGFFAATPCWKASRHGFTYNDRKVNNGGIRRIDLQTTADGSASIAVRGKGEKLQLPAMPVTSDDQFTVQLSNGIDCWETRFEKGNGESPAP